MQDSSNCAADCGQCFNGQGRSSEGEYEVVMCPGGGQGNTGYYCDPQAGSVVSFIPVEGVVLLLLPELER